MKNFISLLDFSESQLLEFLNLSVHMKNVPTTHRPLDGKVLVMLFEMSSTRTRVSFQIGMYHLGGRALYLSSRDSQIGRGESVKDTAKVLSRYADGIVIRTYSHDRLCEYSKYAEHPVINGLTDKLHPCQVMADLLTVMENFDEPFKNLKIAYIGDGNNMANSWIAASIKLGFQLNISSPEGYDVDPEFLQMGIDSPNINFSRNPEEAVFGAHVINTDVWASMNDTKDYAINNNPELKAKVDAEINKRNLIFKPYQVNKNLMSKADPKAIFLHCLPAHRGEEVTAEIIDGPQSKIYDQSENRMHIQKAILVKILR